MFGQFRRLFTNRSLKRTALISTIAYSTIFAHRNAAYKLSQEPNPAQTPEMDAKEQLFQKMTKDDPLLRNIISIIVARSSDIVEGRVVIIDVPDYEQKQHRIAIMRFKKKLYAVKGTCPYEDPLGNSDQNNASFEGAICFNDKLYCPHHGCAFDIETGSVEYGPCMDNLPKFKVEEVENKVILHYPSKLPKRVRPAYDFYSKDDLRRVLIVGGDDPAVIGCIDGLRQYGYTGRIEVVQKEPIYPYRKDFLHKTIPNFRKELFLKPQDRIPNKQERKVLQKSLDKEMTTFLEEKVYDKLLYKPPGFYQQLGVNFIFTDQTYRLIGKRFYPYLSFYGGMKLEYDGLLVASNVSPLYPKIQNFNYNFSTQKQPSNIFMPYQNLDQHQRLVKFLNYHNVQSLMVLGLNLQALEFVEALNKSFPDIKVKVLDNNPKSRIAEQFGPQLQQEIAKEFINKFGVEFYIRIEGFKAFQNNLIKPIEDQILDLELKETKIKNSVKVTLVDGTLLEADCAVLFGNNFQANNEGIKKGKHSDVDFTKAHRIIVDPHCRSDSKRVFAAGDCSSMEFFFTQTRVETNNPLVAYEQGLASAFNLLALVLHHVIGQNVPFHYIPFEKRQFHQKTLFFAGHPGQEFSDIVVMGDIEAWDFLCIYGRDEEIISVSASPSRQLEFNTIREAFRLQCQPNFSALVSGEWTIQNLQMLIRNLNKSGCYRDPIHTLESKENIGDVIWVQRNTEGFSNDHQLGEDYTDVEVDERGYVREL